MSLFHRFRPSPALPICLLAALAACGSAPGRTDTDTSGSNWNEDATTDAGSTTDPEATGDAGAIANPDALVIDQALADVVVVGEDYLRMPADALAGIEPGAIMVGPPHSDYAETNAAGFLRRVEQIKPLGGSVEIVTSQATLEDVFQEADIELLMDSPELELFGDGLPNRDAPWLEIFQSPPMLEGGLGFDFSGTTLLEEPGVKVMLDKGYLRVKPDLDFKVKIGLFKLKYLFAQISAPYDAGLAISASLDFAGDKHVQKTLVENKKIGITKFKVAGIPLTFVLRMTVDVACDLKGSGKADAGAGVRYYGSPSVGVKYESKDWSSWKNLDFNHKEAAGAEVFAAAEVACEAPRVRLEYKLFDVAGPYASVAPTLDTELSASFDAQTCEAATCSFAAKVTPGLKFVVGFLVKALGKTLVDKHSEFPLTFPAWATSWACDAGWLDQNCEPGQPDDVNESGVLAMTPQCFTGTEIESIAWADAQCASAFGPGWRWLEFHHEGGWEAAGPWRDAVGVGERGWVTIDDQSAECFETPSGLTWLREAADSGATCWPGSGLEGPEYSPHSGACNPYDGDTPCTVCRRLICTV